MQPIAQYKLCAILQKQLVANAIVNRKSTHQQQRRCLSATLNQSLESLLPDNRTYSSRQQTTRHYNNQFRLTLEKFYSTTILKPYVDPKYSYAFGQSTNYLEYRTISVLLEERVAANPDYVALICDQEKNNHKITFKQLMTDVNRVAKAMISKFDINRGDFVGVYSFNCYNWSVIQFACAKIGAILSPINPAYKGYELSYLLEKGKIKLLFAAGPKSIQYELNNHIQVLHSDDVLSVCRSNKLVLQNVVYIDEDSDSTENFSLPGVQLHTWKSLDNDAIIYKSQEEADLANCKNPIIIDDKFVQPDDIFAIYYTSGTTGRPKGACISHFTALNCAKFCQMRYELKFGEPRILVSPLPLFHIFAGVLNNLCILSENCTVVWTGHKYDMKVLINAIIAHKCNILTLTPTILIDLLSYVDEHKLKIPLKYIQSGGAALMPEVAERTKKILKNSTEVRTGYGSTENGSVATIQSTFEPEISKNSSVGSPIDFTEIRVVKPNTDTVVPLGELGEIQTRGFNTMIEYLEEPEKTNQVITKERWYRTGDIGSILPHGSLQVTARLKEMIIRGGENVYPIEIQQLVLKLDWVEQVHVFGIPDKRYGEQVCAWVKLKHGCSEAHVKGDVDQNSYHPDDVIAYCKENITYFKVPKYVMFVDDFPMTPTKKAQHHVMAEKTIEHLKSIGQYRG